MPKICCSSRPRRWSARPIVLAVAIAATGFAIPASAKAASGTASLVIDAHSGRTIHARNADAPRYPASLTKIMTLYMLFEALDAGKVQMHTPLVASAHAAAQSPSKIGIKPGQSIRAIDAIRVLVTKSANDVAAVVAENLGGTEENFGRMMTETARRIGMKNTTFRNASGLPNSQQISTARDMSVLALRIMRDYPGYYEFFSTKYFSYAGKRYRSHNKLLFDYRGTDGIKTGYTRASGFNLVASVKRDNRHLIGVVLGGKTAAQRNASMHRILDNALPKAVAVNKMRNVPAPIRNPVAAARKPSHTAAIASVGGGIPAMARFTPPVSQKPEIEEGDAASTAFHVQVGAYAAKSQAAAQLSSVQRAASDLLGNRSGLTVPTSGAKRLYRARFANFTETDAQDACAQLKQRNIDCIVMPAD